MRLLVDIGGTNARFAFAGAEGPRDLRILPVAAFPGFPAALAAYLAGAGQTPTDIAISAAGPVVDGAIRMTNADWTVSAAAAHEVCPGVPVHIVNDLAAVALAIPSLGPDEVRAIHAGKDPAGGAALCLNVGTGFGAAVAIPDGARWSVLATEAGHISLPLAAAGMSLPPDAVTVEQVLSGPGLARLRAALGGVDAARPVFSRLLGVVAGDLVLATGAWAGLYLCGGVLDRPGEVLDLPVFLDAIHARSGLAARLAEVPVAHITLGEPAFRGLARL